MHVLFLHQNSPAQFGPLLTRLRQHTDWKLTFCHRTGADAIPGVESVVYRSPGGATEATHFFSRTFENLAHQSAAVWEALAQRPDIRPDLIVAHAGFVSAVPLVERYRCPMLSYLEFFYHTVGGDMDFRPDTLPSEAERVRARFRNAGLLLDLEASTHALCPTRWQRSRFPQLLQSKIDVIFDGIDTTLWHPRPRNGPRRVGRVVVPDGVELVTYAARGFESMRGFDIFMRFAKALSSRRPNVRFLVVGEDRVCYGGDAKRTGGKTFKEWVLSQDSYDLSKFVFLKPVPPTELAELFSISDLHVYLTVPFVLSWSLLNAMACGATLLASNTPPVQEVIDHERHGLLADFFDIDEMVAHAERVLNDPAGHRQLGETARQRILEEYDIEHTFPRHRALLERVAAGG